MNFKFLSAIALLLGLTNPLNAMPFDPLIGTLKVIDDRTGSYISDIVVRMVPFWYVTKFIIPLLLLVLSAGDIAT